MRLSKFLLEKILEDMVNRVKDSKVFDDDDLESLRTLVSQGNLSSESSVKRLTEKGNLSDEDPQD